jgi:hypothetical protein
MQHRFQWNVIFSIFTTQNTLGSRFRSLEVLLFYASDPYVGIIRMPNDGFWLKLKHVVWCHCEMCLWVTAPNLPFIVKSANSRRCELSWTKVVETPASGDKVNVAVGAMFTAVRVIVWICYRFLLLCLQFLVRALHCRCHCSSLIFWQLFVFPAFNQSRTVLLPSEINLFNPYPANVENRVSS